MREKKGIHRKKYSVWIEKSSDVQKRASSRSVAHRGRKRRLAGEEKRRERPPPSELCGRGVLNPCVEQGGDLSEKRGGGMALL